jgi:hypothetical protein
MNAGLTNLETLKRHLLSASMTNGAQFDLQIKTIGLGIASMIERLCSRELVYQAGAQVETTADREHIIVPRYPIVDVTKVETRAIGDAAWTEETGEPQMFNARSGIVYFGSRLGDSQTMVRVTYSGGYWFDTAEPGDEPGVMPEGASPLPDDLKSAFLLQCEQVWATRDKLGAGLTGQEPGGQFLNTKLSYLDVLPLVKEMLRGYVRHQLV